MRKNVKQEYQNQDVASLHIAVNDLRKNIFLSRMKRASEPEKNTAKIRNLRKEIAYVLTLIQQKES